MAQLGNRTSRRGNGKVPARIGSSTEKQNGEREIEDAGDLDLADVKRGPRRNGAIEPSRKRNPSAAEREMRDAKESQE